MKFSRLIVIAILALGMGFGVTSFVGKAAARPDRPARPECPDKPEKPGTPVGEFENGCKQHRPDRPARPEHPQGK